MHLLLSFVKTLLMGPSRIARLRHAFRVAAGSPAKSSISLERVRIPDRDIATAVERYVSNARLAQYYASTVGATYLNFLQPFNGYGRQSLSRFDVHSVSHVRRDVDSLGENQLDLIIRFMHELWEAIRKDGYCHDLRFLFETHEGEIYLDHVHLSDRGQDLIAKRISEILLSHEGQASAGESCG